MAILFRKTRKYQPGGKQPRISETTTYQVDSDFDKMSPEQKKLLGIYNPIPEVKASGVVIRENQYTNNGPLLIKEKGKDVTTAYSNKVSPAWLKPAENIARFKRNAYAIADDITGGVPVETVGDFRVSPEFTKFVNPYGTQNDAEAAKGVQGLNDEFVIGSFVPGGQKQYAKQVSYPITKGMYMKYGPNLRELMQDPRSFAVFERYFQNR